MESPVRICLGAALVVNVLLLCGTAVDGATIPQETTTIALKEERAPRLNRANSTWPARNKPKTLDVSLNELSPKDSTSEEHTEKNAKYKDRGRVRFGSHLKSTTSSPLRRVRSSSTTSTEATTLIIVTPTPEVKKPLQIMDSMRNYKKTKMPSSISSTTPLSVKKESQSVEEYVSKEEEEEGDSFEKFTSSKFHDSNYFTIPNFDEEDDFNHDSENESSNNKVKQDYSSPSYSFSSYFPKEASFGYKEDSDPFKSSFFDFDSELTTPKNDFFDKKFHQISSSIIKKLDSIKAKSPPPNITNVHKIVKENIGLERLSNNTPSNKSSVFLKNTKEIRLSDNQGAGSANKELSDVQGTSIYYEMSVLSTETYNINHSNDDDCDNDTSAVDTTASTSSQDKLTVIKPTQPTFESESFKPTESQISSEAVSTLSSNILPISSVSPIINSVSVVPISTQSYLPTTERITRLFSSSYSRNRNYSKRLNLTGTKDSPNSVTLKADAPTNTARPLTRKFHFTTPKNKPIWMSPRRNITRVYSRPTNPTTIYSEHFNIKDKYSTTNTRQPVKSMLTTVPSAEIDPVLQSDIGGTKKVVHSQSISDNTIPSLRKRGSTRFTTSTATSAEKELELSDLEIPSTAWALAGLIIPPSLPSTVVNATENELQKVGDVVDSKETIISSTTTTTASPISNDIITKRVTEVDQNKLPWQPVYSPTSPSLEQITSTEAKNEKLTAESNISVSSAEPVTTEATKDNTVDSKPKDVKPLWIPATDMETSTAKSVKDNETIPPVDGTKSTGFESITKLPADITTPQDETVASSEVNQTVADEKPKVTTQEFEVTTIRFSYVPTEEIEETTETENIATINSNDVDTTTVSWHSVMPTRTKLTTIEDEPITTYRPKYMTSTETVETTTVIPDTTPVLEVSSQVIANATEKLPQTTETVIQTTTEEVTTQPTTEITTEAPTQAPTTTSTTTTTTTMATTTTTTKPPTTTTTTEMPEDTTTIVVEIVTEINIGKVTVITPGSTTTELPAETTETDCASEENSDSNEIIYETKTTPETTTFIETTTIEKKIAPFVETTSGIAETTSRFVETTPPSAETTSQTAETTVPYTETTEPANIIESTTAETTDADVTKPVNDLEDLTSYAGEVTTEASTRVLPEEAGSGAAVAIAVSTIGVIALILLIGLLLVVRRRGRRGIYAQRCTPVSLDAYSLDSVSVGHRKGNHRLRASKRSYGNPAYDDEVTSHPMQYPALANFALDVESMTAEFSEIPSVSVRPEEVPSGCEDKNRYSNVLPLPETRVPLRKIGNDPTTEYINANFVTGPGNIRNYYILAQAPLSNTVIDFWRMVWEQNSRLIVMLTEYMENGVEKCYEYLPPSEISDNKRTFGEFQIILKKREQRDKYAISSVQVVNLTTRTWREVTHLWYFWPAKGVPEDYDSVIDFLFEMRSYMKIAQTGKEYDEEGVEVIYGDQSRSSFNNLSKLREDNGSGNGVNVYSPAKAEEQMRRGYANNGTLSRMKAASEVEGIRPCVVTCASGAGRSAALCALEVCARALHAGGAADVPRAVRLLRTQRPHALSNRHHYMFVYKVLSEYGNKMMGGGDTI